MVYSDFFNRLDEIIVFHPLSDHDLLKIIQMMIDQINAEQKDERPQIRLSEAAMAWLLEKACQDKRYGARPLRRAIQRYVEDPIANLLIRGGNTKTQNIEVDTRDDKLIFSAS